MNDKLQNAIKCLQIRDVYLKDNLNYTVQEFDPKYFEDIDDILIQFKHIVSKSELLSLDEDNSTINIFRTYIELGCRWVFPTIEPTNNESEDAPEVLAAIESTYVAEYLLEQETSRESLNEFALKNASYHVWPYWRELLASNCSRLNLPKVVLPTIQVAQNYDACDD